MFDHTGTIQTIKLNIIARGGNMRHRRRIPTLERLELRDVPTAGIPGLVPGSGAASESTFSPLMAARNRPPIVNLTITAGLRNGKFDAGTPINFTGTAVDPQGGTLTGANFRWRVDYLMATRLGDPDGDGLPGVTRPFVAPFSNATGGTFTPATRGGYKFTDVAYLIRLSVTNAAGLTTNKSLLVLPNKVTLTLQSDPPGLALTRDGQNVSGPHRFGSVVGFERVIGAAPRQEVGTINYVFAGWDDFGAATHTIVTPTTNTTYLASYVADSVTGPIRFEAEALGRRSYLRESVVGASNRMVASLMDGTPGAKTGTLRGVFQGPNGRYLIQIAYYDENDGTAALSMKLGNQRIAAWQLNQNLGSPDPLPRTRVIRNLGLHELTQGTPFEITGVSHRGEYARVDVLIFTQVQGNLVRAINAGGPDRGIFQADTLFEGGQAAYVEFPVNTQGAVNPVAPIIYQSFRTGETIRYFLTGLTAGTDYAIRLHFSENVATAANVNVFNLAINGVNRLSDFDVFAEAGARFQAVTVELNATADSFGQVTLEFVATRGRARICAIEVYEL